MVCVTVPPELERVTERSPPNANAPVPSQLPVGLFVAFANAMFVIVVPDLVTDK